MPSEKLMKQGMQAYIDAFNRSDAEGVADLYADDATVEDPVGKEVMAGKATIAGFEMIPVETQKSYAETNLAVTLVPSSGPWSVTAFVNNLDDKRPYGTAFYNSIMGVIGASVGPARTEGIRAAYKF